MEPFMLPSPLMIATSFLSAMMKFGYGGYQNKTVGLTLAVTVTKKRCQELFLHRATGMAPISCVCSPRSVSIGAPELTHQHRHTLRRLRHGTVFLIRLVCYPPNVTVPAVTLLPAWT